MTCSAQRETQLMTKGWTRQFTTDEPRLSEAVAEYQDLGLEVHLEPVDPATCAQDSECTACFEQPEAADRFKIIFTRPAPGGGVPKESL